MKYILKEYPEYKETVDNMSIDELLRAVVCPSIGAGCAPITDVQSLYIGKCAKEEMDKFVDAINGTKELPTLLVADMEFGAGESVDGARLFPSMRAAADSKDENLCYMMGKIAAIESLNAGYHWTFGPCVDILGNKENPIVSTRTAGDDADTVIKYGGAYMKGLQENGLISTLKHFPGDGYCTDDQHITTPDNPLSKEEWDASFGKVYSTLIEEGAMSIMPGHIALPAYDEIDPETGICPPATVSKNLLTGLLREKLGFDGIIISDAITMSGFCGYNNLYVASAKFLEAGGDSLLFMPCDDYYFNGMKEQIESGLLKVDTLKNRAYRMMCFRRDYFDNMYPSSVPSISKEESDKVVMGICSAGVQVIRDRNNILPYDLKGKKVANVVVYNNSNEDLLAATSELTELLKAEGADATELRDPGPGVLEQIGKQGTYDLVICSVLNAPRWGTNQIKIGGVMTRNFMCGWMKYKTPVIFVVYGSPFFADVYRAMADTVINTNGYGEYTNKCVIDSIKG